MKITNVDFFTGKVLTSFHDLESAAKHSAQETHSEGELERLREYCDNLADMLGRLLSEVHGLRNEQIENVLGSRYRVVER